MKTNIKKIIRLTGIAALVLAGAASMTNAAAAGRRKLLIAGFSVPGEAVMQGIAPAFARKWAAAHGGEVVEFDYSWAGSSAQARNVVAGLEADVVYFSDWSDVDQIAKVGLITGDWNANGRSIVSKSLVVFRLNPGNPLGIRNWLDLQKPGVRIVTPNPRTSGGARWNILALYGAALKSGANAAAAENALRALYRNVVVFDENARASTQSFERGVADVSITYENELLLRRRQGQSVEFIIPASTIVIENPAVVVDAYAQKHGTADIANTFVAYLHSDEAQKVLADFGLRPANPAILKRFASRFPTPEKAFDLLFLGGGPAIHAMIFDRGGLWDRIVRTERRTER